METKRSFTDRFTSIVDVPGRHASAAVFLLGFLLDLFTLPRIDHPAVPYLVFGHMAIIGGSILINRILHERRGDRFERLQMIFPLLTAFSFGALLSFLFIYYARSGAPGASWPFLILLGAIMLGSEFFRKKLEGLRFYVILYAFLVILLAVLFVPILLGKITVATFFLSIVVGLLLCCVYISLLFAVTSRETRLILPRTVQSVVAGTVLLIASYFSGVMPAIPLVLKEGDVYSSVTRTPLGEYVRQGSSRLWYTGILTPRIHEWTKGSPVYFYSAVFAPTDLTGTIVHDWQYKNREGGWTSVTRVSFPIRGGRADGYRGYSFKESVTEGKWRVVVSLSDGRVIGRVPFVVQALP
jgi:hypothetical protein